MVGINLSFARSSLCLVHFSTDGRDGLALRALDGEASSPLVNYACTLVDIDMTLSIMRWIKTSSKTFLAMLNSSNIHSRG
jgi:hypothetical protein